MLMNMSQYARHRGVTPAAVRKAVLAKRISTTDNGKIDPSIADREWGFTTRGRVDINPLPASAPTAEYDGDRVSKMYSAARAQREQMAAKLLKLEYDEKAGTLIAVEEVKEIWIKRIMATRSLLLGIPARVAGQCRAAVTEVEAAEIIRNAVYEALTELAANDQRV